MFNCCLYYKAVSSYIPQDSIISNDNLFFTGFVFFICFFFVVVVKISVNTPTAAVCILSLYQFYNKPESVHVSVKYLAFRINIHRNNVLLR